jgi:hypothetical protein
MSLKTSLGGDCLNFGLIKRGSWSWYSTHRRNRSFGGFDNQRDCQFEKKAVK